jgi:hypothetical protein
MQTFTATKGNTVTTHASQAELRIDRAIINNPWTMNRAFTLLLFADRLDVLYTGPAVTMNTRYTGGVAASVANAVVDRGVAKIEAAEQEIDRGDLDELVRRAHCARVLAGALGPVEHRARIGMFSRFPGIFVATAARRFKFRFPYTDPATVERFAARLAALSGR